MPSIAESIVVAITISLSPLLAQSSHAQVPCYDSDGDGWADPEHSTDSCPPDNCPGHYNPDQINCYNVGDPIADGAIDVLDVIRSIEYAFRGLMPSSGSGCQNELIGGSDVNCDGQTSIVDVVKLVNVAFRGGVNDFCRPCLCDCYPSSCWGESQTSNLLPNNGSFEQYCQATIEGWIVRAGEVEFATSTASDGGLWCANLISPWSGSNASLQSFLPHPITGGIYRLRAEFYDPGPYNKWVNGLFIRLSYDGQTNESLELWDWGEWTKVEVIDTVVSTAADDTLRIEIVPYFMYFPNPIHVDRVSLEYLGQAAP